MKKAGQKKTIENYIGKQDRPLITVVTDEAWLKKSYKNNYDALSCVTSIFCWNVEFEN